MSFPDSGSTFYEDDYNTLYEVIWETVNLDGVEVLDFTTIIKQPYVWGEEAQGFIRNKVVYRRGICTTIRQIFTPSSGGYVILAEGMSQIICIFPTTFSGDEVPTDIFEFHVDSAVSDFFEHEITCGPRFSDPDDVGASPIVFADVGASGNLVQISGKQTFQFVNVWDQDDNIFTYDCDGTGTGA
jgi:hypothetical protein